jgi:hypothetical protein
VDECRIKELAVIWRQNIKMTGRGHYSHRITFDPNGRHMYIASGDRLKPAGRLWPQQLLQQGDDASFGAGGGDRGAGNKDSAHGY